MTMIIQVKRIKSKCMVAWQNPPVRASKHSALRPLFPKKKTFSKGPKQVWVSWLVYKINLMSLT